jgi:hypothetical protein
VVEGKCRIRGAERIENDAGETLVGSYGLVESLGYLQPIYSGSQRVNGMLDV